MNVEMMRGKRDVSLSTTVQYAYSEIMRMCSEKMCLGHF